MTGELIISPSQFESIDYEDGGCYRKWWFVRVKNTPELQRDYFTFGTVLHAVIERYLAADDLGRDPKTGKAVDLYPPGWQQCIDKKTKQVGRVSNIEADLIKRLVKAAIEEGVLVRHPGRRVELPFRRHLLTASYKGRKVRVVLQGTMDLLHEEGIDDHKSTKSMKYAKSKAQLRKNPQLLIYAHEWFTLKAELGEEVTEDSKCKIAHNVFCKDPKLNKVKRTPATITWGHVKKFMLESVRPAALKLVKYMHAEEWHQVPGPKNTAHTCNKYGGCSFRSICGRRETLATYNKRMKRIKERSESEIET